jgi:hypothetical protein
MAFYVRHRRADMQAMGTSNEPYDSAFEAVFAAGMEVGHDLEFYLESGTWYPDDYVVEVLVGDEQDCEVIFSHEYSA